MRSFWTFRYRCALLSAVLLTLSGCVSVPNLPFAGSGAGPDRTEDKFSCTISPSSCVSMIIPPLFQEAGGLRTVAIVPGAGNGASSVASELESRLSALRVDDQPYYQIVPANDPSRQGVFEVNVTNWAVNDSREIQSRTICPGKKLFCGKEGVTKQVSCAVRKATVGSLIRLRDGKGKQIATRNNGAVATSTQCAGEDGALLTAPEVLGQATAELMKTVQDELAVRTVQKRVRVLEDTANIEAANIERFKMALGFARGGRLLDRACPLFEELVESEPRSVSVHYNAGFCAQARGDWRKANTLYSKADANTNQPMNELKSALDETRPYTVQKK